MKASELIAQLQALVEEYGDDREVKIRDAAPFFDSQEAADHYTDQHSEIEEVRLRYPECDFFEIL